MYEYSCSKGMLLALKEDIVGTGNEAYVTERENGSAGSFKWGIVERSGDRHGSSCSIEMKKVK